MPYGLAVSNGNGTFSYPQEKNSLFETYLGFSDWINGKVSSIGSFQKNLSTNIAPAALSAKTVNHIRSGIIWI